MNIIPRPEAAELKAAYQYAGLYPPITKQSLSELDIQNIINNIKLRHDVNFDRDLSFRPNLDGAKGREKLRAAGMYWKALTAELELYARLFQGSPSLSNSQNIDWSSLIHHAQKRIPLMFKTVREVLKSLVPDRDQSRVDEHLDSEMLMQEIEKGVCDLPRLAEWMAHLLKEHCAPMRDEWVDRMVEWVNSGDRNRSSELIVDGLRELLGILEAMKLDVANHQIKNLKALLIEDTINFERNYHLGRIVERRGRINTEAAEQWYASALQRFRQQSCTPPPKDNMRVQLGVFVRAVVSMLFSRGPSCEFPETFYLDQERLLALRSEILDIVFFEICFDMFGQLLKVLKYNGPIPYARKADLRASLLAIIREGAYHGSSQWISNRENISLELFRHAWQVTGGQQTFHPDVDLIQTATKHLDMMFENSFSTHACVLEDAILPQILTCIHGHLHSSPYELFQTLVAPTTPPPPPPAPHHPSVTIQHDTSSPYPGQFSDISNRISHIVLLHWRIWGPIVYVLPDDQPTPTSKIPEDVPSTPQSHTLPAPPVDSGSNTVEPLDPGQETQLAGPAPEAPIYK
ncbi:T-complex 11 [Lindgomyces ingoldianus]|uniref:T-complex 11 n=1 Tax=Lindgomyces ingoldianus TaxID=673940 RepID=A0ACB6QKR0_9PLEO|nr:T-complex 11 [Lindgomyces ingoldianus]KAF2467110.1 T-complex 11 [Lindgomyces ingoldianus]